MPTIIILGQDSALENECFEACHGVDDKREQFARLNDWNRNEKGLEPEA